MRQSPSWTPLTRIATRTRRWSCNFCVTTWLSGHPTRQPTTQRPAIPPLPTNKIKIGCLPLYIFPMSPTKKIYSKLAIFWVCISTLSGVFIFFPKTIWQKSVWICNSYVKSYQIEQEGHKNSFFFLIFFGLKKTLLILLLLYSQILRHFFYTIAPLPCVQKRFQIFTNSLDKKKKHFSSTTWTLLQQLFQEFQTLWKKGRQITISHYFFPFFSWYNDYSCSSASQNFLSQDTFLLLVR